MQLSPPFRALVYTIAVVVSAVTAASIGPSLNKVPENIETASTVRNLDIDRRANGASWTYGNGTFVSLGHCEY